MARDPYDPYEYTRNAHVDMHIGLSDGLLFEMTLERGATLDEIREELKSTLDINIEVMNDPSPMWVATPESIAYDRRLDLFTKAPESDIYFVFYDDCGEIDPPIPDAWPIADDWNALANWREQQPFFDVWNRLKVPFDVAVARIAQMQPLPPRQRRPYTMETRCKDEIDALLPQLVDISDEDNAPYKLVCDQKKIREDLRYLFAELAAEKLMWAMSQRPNAGEHFYNPPSVRMDSYISGDILRFHQCQYDDWTGWHTWFQTFCQVGNLNSSGGYDDFPMAVWDLSNDPDFAQSEQKVFRIKIEYDDAHAAGW